MERAKEKTIIIMSVVVVIMTLLGYVCGILSNNIIIYQQAQEECYEWLETECPCMFPEQLTIEGPKINFTLGGQNESIQT